jgi:phosphonate transport system ATP-binding protein
VLDALATINREDGLTVLCNLHSLDAARTYCDRIVGMAAGRVVFDGPPASLTGDRVREIYGDGECEAHPPSPPALRPRSESGTSASADRFVHA